MWMIFLIFILALVLCGLAFAIPEFHGGIGCVVFFAGVMFIIFIIGMFVNLV